VRALRQLLAIGLFFAAGSARADPAACVARYFGVDPAHFAAPAPSGSRQNARSFAERLEHPTLADMFSIRYRTGPIAPVTEVDHDPGRIRLTPLFAAAYPAGKLVSARFFGHRVRVQPKVAAALARVEKRLSSVTAARPFVAKLGGAYNDRAIAGTDRKSAHAWGIAIDLDPDLSYYWRWERHGWKNRLPQSVVDAFEAEGFIWGGRWYHFDTMHFEYRPELLDPSCYPAT
jgi:hypothetical protein